MLRKLTMLTAVLALSACASANGPSYQPVKAYDGQAKVVVYRSAFPYATPIKVNGKHYCDAPANSFFVLDAKPNQPLSLSYSDLFRTSEFTFTPKSGQTYYVKLERHMTGVLASGFGLGWNLVVQQQNADFIFTDGNEAEALKTKEIACD